MADIATGAHRLETGEHIEFYAGIDTGRIILTETDPLGNGTWAVSIDLHQAHAALASLTTAIEITQAKARGEC